MKHSRPEPTYDALQSWMFISVIGFMVLGLLASVVTSRFAERRRQIRADWPEVRGTPIDTRIVLESRRNGPFQMYVGQCLVEYTVAGRRYTVWAGGGYMDPERKFVAERMVECPVSHYSVHYNPEDPADADAHGASTTP